MRESLQPISTLAMVVVLNQGDLELQKEIEAGHVYTLDNPPEYQYPDVEHGQISGMFAEANNGNMLFWNGAGDEMWRVTSLPTSQIGMDLEIGTGYFACVNGSETPWIIIFTPKQP